MTDKRDLLLTLVFLKFIGERFKQQKEKIRHEIVEVQGINDTDFIELQLSRPRLLSPILSVFHRSGDCEHVCSQSDLVVHPLNYTGCRLFCAETDKVLAKYFVLNGSEQLFAAKYMAYVPTEEELSREIEQQKRFFLEQHEMEDGYKIRRPSG